MPIAARPVLNSATSTFPSLLASSLSNSSWYVFWLSASQHRAFLSKHVCNVWYIVESVAAMLQQDVLSENLKKQSYQFILRSGRASSKFGLQPSFEIHSFAISRIAVNIPIQHSPLPSLRRIPEGRRELQYWRAGRRLRSLSPLYGNSRKQGKRHLSLYHHLSLYPLQKSFFFIYFFCL